MQAKPQGELTFRLSPTWRPPRWNSGLPHCQVSLCSCSLTAPVGAVFPAGCALLPRNPAACEMRQYPGPPPLLWNLGQEERWICIPYKTQLSWKGFFFFFPKQCLAVVHLSLGACVSVGCLFNLLMKSRPSTCSETCSCSGRPLQSVQLAARLVGVGQPQRASPPHPTQGLLLTSSPLTGICTLFLCFCLRSLLVSRYSLQAFSCLPQLQT